MGPNSSGANTAHIDVIAGVKSTCNPDAELPVAPAHAATLSAEAAVGGDSDRLVNAFTVDVEDYYQVSAFERTIQRSDWDRYDSRVVESTRRILDLLEQHNTRATFFVLGWIARRHPGLVREIHRRGHEIGTHGYWHRLIYELSPDEFRRDLRQSRDAIQDAVGRPIRSHRAPSFSITRQTLWALDVLADEGFSIDSSVLPVRRDPYGISDDRSGFQQVKTSAGPLWEFPVPVASLARLNAPIDGGAYFRLHPIQWTLRHLSRINQVHGRPFVFCVHPWELDPDQPRLRAGTWFSRRRHYANLQSTAQKLNVLLKSFRFGRIDDLLPRKSPKM